MWPKIGWATKVTAFAVLSGILPNVLSYSQKEKIKKNEFMLCILENIFKAIRGAVENGGEKS